MKRIDFLKSLAVAFVAPKLIEKKIEDNPQPVPPEVPRPQFFTKDDWEDTRISQFYRGEEVLRIGDVVGLYHDGKIRLVHDKRYVFGKVVHVEAQRTHIVWVEH